MKIFVVSLSGDHSRKQEMIAQLENYRFDYGFVDAVDGRNGLAEEFEPLVDRQKLSESARILSDTEIACALSHLAAVAKVTEMGLTSAIILEDDAILSEDFQQLVHSGKLEIDGAPLILLFHQNARALRKSRQPLFGPYGLRTPINNPWGCVAYFVSASGAKEIYKRSMPVAGVADWGFNIFDIGAKAVSPAIVGHPPIDPKQSMMVNRKYGERISLRKKLFDPKYRNYIIRKIRSERIR